MSWGGRLVGRGMWMDSGGRGGGRSGQGVAAWRWASRWESGLGMVVMGRQRRGVLFLDRRMELEGLV